MGRCAAEIKNNPLCVADRRGLVVVATSAAEPRNNSEGFVGGSVVVVLLLSFAFYSMER